jgi:class 3 adenylate cyclase
LENVHGKILIGLALALALASSASHAEQHTVTVSGNSRFHESLSGRLVRVSSEEARLRSPLDAELEASGARGKEAATSIVVQSDQYQWYRIALDNPSDAPIPLTIFNPLLVYSFVVVSGKGDESAEKGGYGDIDVLRDPEHYFAFTHFEAPPGRSHVYIGAKAPDRFHHAVLSPEIASVRRFGDYWIIRTLLTAVFFGLILLVALIVGSLALLIGDRLAALYFALIVVYGAAEISLSGLGLSYVTQHAPWIARLWPTIALAHAMFYMMFAMQFFKLWSGGFQRWFRMSAAALGSVTLLFHFDALEKSQYLGAACFLVVLFTAALMHHAMRRDRALLMVFIVAFAPGLGVALLRTLQHTGYTSADSRILETLPPLAGLLNGTVVLLYFGYRILRIKRKRDIFEANLKTIVSADHLQRLDKNKLLIDVEPAVREVTILFIDVVGYSILFKRMLPQESFRSIKTLLGKLTTIIHKYDGVIDRSLGDGCLAFFGSDLSGQTAPGHQKTAVECALEIQRTIVAEVNAKGVRGTEQLFMLRIGINTAEVCIGNIGDATRFDFTISGNGVVHASRLESACEPCKINISTSTHAALDAGFRSQIAPFHKMIAIKHEKALGECYEVNPFADDMTQLDRCRQAFYESAGFRMRHERFSPKCCPIVFHSHYGELSIINFSYEGFCILSPTYLGKGVSFIINLTPLCHHDRIEAINPITVEVAWGAPHENNLFVLGVSIKSLDHKKKTLIFDAVMALAQQGSEGELPEILAAS